MRRMHFKFCLSSPPESKLGETSVDKVQVFISARMHFLEFFCRQYMLNVAEALSHLYEGFYVNLKKYFLRITSLSKVLGTFDTTFEKLTHQVPWNPRFSSLRDANPIQCSALARVISTRAMHSYQLNTHGLWLVLALLISNSDESHRQHIGILRCIIFLAIVFHFYHNSLI